MGGFISPSTLEQIKAASDIVEVIGGYVPLKRAGANFIALCPFHKEKTPSFNVNPQRQIFHCFGCHKGGDVFTFVKEYEGIDFPDAIRRLAERARIPIETEATPGGTASRHIKDQLLNLHEQVTHRWQAALAGESGQIARDYLARRAVPNEAIEMFRIGYAPDAWDDTVNWAKSKKFDLALAEQAGLLVRKESSDHFYDRFRGRLIFPICDEQGRVVAFSGRILTGDEKTAKYVNSPETPIFTKGKVMFGLDKSKRALLETHRAVICEGQLDLIRCFMAGVKNIVAPQGTAFTPDHARLLKRYVDEVILCFDSDNAGQNAAVRALDILLATGLAVRVAEVPAPHDPDSFIRDHGAAAFVGLIESARGFFDYYLDRLCTLHDSAADRGRTAIVRAMGEAARKTGSDVLIDACAQKTALRVGVATDAVRAEFKKGGRANPSDEESETAPERPNLTEQERWLLRLMLESDRHIDWISAHLQLEWLRTATAREIAAQRLRTEEWPGLSAWLAQVDNAPWQNLITEMLADGRPIPDEVALLQGAPGRDGLIKILRDKHIDRRLAAINIRLSDASTPEQEQAELLAEAQQLRQFKKQPLAAAGDPLP